MIECMLAAPSSGSGKTALACALLAALQKRGLAPCAFKCGPDYIDPMFHRSVLGVESHNLDLFLCGEDAARTLYARHAAGHGAAVVEGVMGFYDGVGGVTARASAWHVARTLDLPVLLVLRPRGASLTLAAQVRGLLAFRQPSHIAGILLNDCSAMLAQSLAPMLEQETGVPVLGYLPHMPEAVFGSRHLGLYTAAEIDGLAARIGALAAQLEQSVDMPRLLALCGRRTADGAGRERKALARKQAARIAVARDEAFCFSYAETLESLRDGDRILIAEGCTHHRQCEDIGTVKLPRWLQAHTGKSLQFNFTSGTEFPEELSSYALVIHCGGCMLNEREMKSRVRRCIDSGTPITNYGIAIAQIHGILRRSLEPFPEILSLLG